MAGFFDSLFNSPDVPKAPDYSPLIGQSATLQGAALGNNDIAKTLSNTITSGVPTAQSGYTTATGQLAPANAISTGAAGTADTYNDYAAAAQQLMQQQFDWAKKTYAENKGQTDQIVNSFLNTQNTQNGYAAEDRDRYKNTFQPLEDKLVQDANDYASEGRKDLNRGRAMADVGQNFEAQRQNTMRDLESFGINPGAVRYAGLDSGLRAQQAAAQAAAGTQADLATDATARALRSEAIGLGRQIPGQVQSEAGLGLQAGTAAGNTTLAQTASGASTMGTAPQLGALTGTLGGVATGNTNAATGALNAGTSALNSGANYLNSGTSMNNAGTSALNAGTSAIGAAGGALNTAGSLTGNQFTNQMSQYDAENKQSSGLGTLAGIAAPLLLEGGGEVPNTVPQYMSPSGGHATDDVPAKLTAGEFVFPKDVTAWYGEEKLQKLIERARMGKSGAQAKPQSALPRG